MSDKPASPARGRKKTAPPAQQPPQEEVVVRLPLADLYPFPDHPFQVRDDEEMRETIQSVKEYGVIVPAIVRPREEGGYEIVAGHRRKYACEQAGLDTMPVLIRNLDRDAATIIMVDSNLQRENILPSERAKAYKMKLEAIKRQGARNDLTSPKISAKLRSDDEIGQQMGVSGDTVRNYISLTNLVPELMQMVDEKKIALSPAYQIAALKPEEQQMAERIEAGVVGYAEVVRQMFPHDKRLMARLEPLIRDFPGMLWQDERHRQRMEGVKIHLGHSKRRDTPAFFAVMFMFTSDEDI